MEKFLERGYKASVVKEKNDKANAFIRVENDIPLVISYNWTAPNVSKSMQKHWPILQINETMRKAFTNTPNIIQNNKTPQRFCRWKQYR